MSEIIQTQVMSFAEYWIIFIFFICLSLVFLLTKKNKEMALLHMLVMTISVLIAGLAMLPFDVLFTLCFIMFQVISWIINLLMVKV
jgi:hypothetical protein